MTLTELRYIVALHQTAHFGKAAQRCHVSQPTLSVAIKKLEEELNITLFERSRGQVVITQLGEQIVQQAQRVLEQANLINDIADIGRDPLGSTLSVGAIFTVGPYLFPHFIPRLQKLAPAMPLYIEENFTANLREKLRNSELDAIIIALPFTEPDVVCQTLYEESFVVLLNKDHNLCSLKTIKPKHLDNEKVLLLGDGHCFRDQVLAACPDLNPSPSSDPSQSVVEGSSLETLKYMVASGLGITILPESAAQLLQFGNNSLTTRPLKSGPEGKRTIALAWRASFPRPQAIDALSQSIKLSAPGKATK